MNSMFLESQLEINITYSLVYLIDSIVHTFNRKAINNKLGNHTKSNTQISKFFKESMLIIRSHFRVIMSDGLPSHFVNYHPPVKNTDHT